MLGIERATNLLAWSAKETLQVPAGFDFPASEVELETSGTDLSFLGSSGARNPFGIPRLAFDGMFENGLTLGGSLVYVSADSKAEYYDGSNKQSREGGSSAVFILAPRAGVVFEASSNVGIWLRGGITRTSSTTTLPKVDADTGEFLSGTAETTTTLVDLTLDPQLVISPIPHVGITVGLALDFGLSGTYKDVTGVEHDVKASSYGVTGGLVAIF